MDNLESTMPTEDLFSAYNYYHIGHIRIPRGLDVRVCEPDFEYYRKKKVYICNDKTIEKLSCELYTGNELCQFNISNARVQMLYYTFETEYGCYDASDLTNGFQLTSSYTPNQITPCLLPTHAVWVDCTEAIPLFTEPPENVCCRFQCLDGYTKTLTSCDAKCSSIYSEVCQEHQNAVSVCNEMTTPRYECSDCNNVAGLQVIPWSTRSGTDECEYMTCDPGHYSNSDTGYVCTPCPENTFADVSGSGGCQICPDGTESHESASVCTSCFEESSSHTPMCTPGYVVSQNVQQVLEYFTNLKSNYNFKDNQISNVIRASCDAGWACLACLPGQRQAGNTCQDCPMGTYQTNFASTDCVQCYHGQTTQTTGSTEVHDCRCDVGFT